MLVCYTPVVPTILLNKPYRVLSQFRDAEGRATLATMVDTPSVYPAGRLDFDSEGLIVLTDDGQLQAQISQPQSGVLKHYWAQVEGVVDRKQKEALQRGVHLKDGPARAARVSTIGEPEILWERVPPIRVRKHIPTSWLEIALSGGRNRQIRRMTAAVGLPTLRLIRYQIGPWDIDHLRPGDAITIDNNAAWRQLRA